MVKKAATTYTYAVGRRKSAVAAVKIFAGKGDSLINGTAVDTYFPGEILKVRYNKPFVITDTSDKYYFQAKIVGGGTEGQADALCLSIARALKKINDAWGSDLRNAGLLTVDPRVRERRMVGTGGKARRQKQSPKR